MYRGQREGDVSGDRRQGELRPQHRGIEDGEQARSGWQSSVKLGEKDERPVSLPAVMRRGEAGRGWIKVEVEIQGETQQAAEQL
jgi:hypothetical protein